MASVMAGKVFTDTKMYPLMTQLARPLICGLTSTGKSSAASEAYERMYEMRFRDCLCLICRLSEKRGRAKVPVYDQGIGPRPRW